MNVVITLNKQKITPALTSHHILELLYSWCNSFRFTAIRLKQKNKPKKC